MTWLRNSPALDAPSASAPASSEIQRKEKKSPQDALNHCQYSRKLCLIMVSVFQKRKLNISIEREVPMTTQREAMGSKLPCVTTTMGPNPELFYPYVRY